MPTVIIVNKASRRACNSQRLPAALRPAKSECLSPLVHRLRESDAVGLPTDGLTRLGEGNKLGPRKWLTTGSRGIENRAIELDGWSRGGARRSRHFSLQEAGGAGIVRASSRWTVKRRKRRAPSPNFTSLTELDSYVQLPSQGCQSRDHCVAMIQFHDTALCPETPTLS